MRKTAIDLPSIRRVTLCACVVVGSGLKSYRHHQSLARETGPIRSAGHGSGVDDTYPRWNIFQWAFKTHIGQSFVKGLLMWAVLCSVSCFATSKA